MFGPVFVVVAFFICLFLSWLVCNVGGSCKPIEFGVTATIGVIVFIILVKILQSQTVFP